MGEYQYELALPALSRLNYTIVHANDSLHLLVRYEKDGKLEIFKDSDTLPPVISVDIRPLVDSLMKKDNIANFDSEPLAVEAESPAAGRPE